jgi:hypothetical protein
MRMAVAVLTILSSAACVPAWRVAPLAAGAVPTRLPEKSNSTPSPWPKRSVSLAPGAISGACPSEQMSCFPGCAFVGDAYACGTELLLLAGGLAATLIYVAAAEALTLEDFCGKYGALCMKARPKAQPRRYPDKTVCIFIGSGGSPTWGKGLTCRYNCNGDRIEMRLEPPANRCPGEDALNNLIEWAKLKWLEITRLL